MINLTDRVKTKFLIKFVVPNLFSTRFEQREINNSIYINKITSIGLEQK